MGVLRIRSAAPAALALVVSSFALVGPAAPASAAPVPLGLEAGDLVVSDTGHDRVVVQPADGGPIRELATGLGEPAGLVVTPEGDVVVADSIRAKIVRIPADGGEPEDLNPYQGAWGVTHLALDGAGGVLFSGTGWGGIGRVPLTGGDLELHVYESPYPNYAGLGVLSDGDIVAVDCCDSSTTRMEYDGSDQRAVPELTYDPSLDPSTVQPRNMSGLAVTPDDRLVVAETWNDLVWETDGTGGRTSFGEDLDEPAAVALGVDGAAYVADRVNNRVVRVSPDRSAQTDMLDSADLLHPSGVAVVPVSPAEVGDAFVGTAGGDVVRVRGSETVTVASGLDPVSDVVVRDDGEVVVATGDRLVELSGDGSTSSELTSFAHGVQALALRPDGRLLAAVDDGSGGTDVRIVSADGSVAPFDASPLYAFTALAADDLTETYAAFQVAPTTGLVVQTATGSPVGAPFGFVSGLAAGPDGSFLVADSVSGSVHRVGSDDPSVALASGIGGPERVALALDGDVLVAASGDDELLSVPAAGGTPTTVAAIDDPVGVGVYVPRPTLDAVTDFPGTGNVGTAYDGYDFDAAGNDGGAVTFRAYGELPPGVALDATTGELAGTPTATGTYEFRVVAANAARGAASQELEIEVGKRLQTISFGTPPTGAAPDDTYTPTVTGGGSGNPVTLSIHPDSAAVCTLDATSGVVTFLIGGVCSVLADQAGDADHAAAPTARQDVYVDKLAQTVSFTSTAPVDATVGGTYTPTATGGPSSYDITFEITGNPMPPTFMTYPCTYDAATGQVTFDHVGTCRLRATKGGDERYWTASRTQNITIGAGTLEFISTKPEPGRVGGTYTPAVSAPDAWFRIDAGEGTACSYDDSTGEVSFLAPGECEVVADISNDDYAPNTVRETITVAKLAQAITFVSLPPVAAPLRSTYEPEATGGGSGNPVTFSIDPASAGVCSLDAGEVRLDHAGSCVIRADQEGDASYEAAPTVTQTVVVRKDPGSVTVTSPATGVVGQRYDVTATTVPAGGDVEVAVDSPAVCHTDEGDVVLDHAGTCELTVTWPGDADHEAAEAEQSIVVSAASTAVDLDVRGRALVATVSVLAPGGGRPTGLVEFSDGATVLGTAALNEGIGGVMTAVLVRDRGTVGGQHRIRARYVGSTDHAASEHTVAWVDPTIRYTLSSASGRSAAGWYRGPVTVTFRCTPGTAPLIETCPAPVVLDANRRGGRTIIREVFARDGTVATVVVTGIRIDLEGPRVRVRGVQPGRTYAAPRTLRCAARDRWSGVDTCVVKTTRKKRGKVIVYRAVATDRAGHRSVVRGKYRVR